MKLELTQKETQAILSASITFSEKELKPRGNSVNTFWLILGKDLESGLKKMQDQYYKQLENEEKENGTSN
tara:strand:- start:606 stop:815 length:210 start_codon:yes stop_codon:yes gene_type:complete